MKLLLVQLSTLVMVITANSETEESAQKWNDNVDELKGLAIAFMQNTITVTEKLYDHQTQKIRDIMLSLSAAKIYMQDLNLKVVKNEKDDAVMAIEISKLEDEVKALKGDLNHRCK